MRGLRRVIKRIGPFLVICGLLFSGFVLRYVDEFAQRHRAGAKFLEFIFVICVLASWVFVTWLIGQAFYIFWEVTAEALAAHRANKPVDRAYWWVLTAYSAFLAWFAHLLYRDAPHRFAPMFVVVVAIVVWILLGWWTGEGVRRLLSARLEWSDARRTRRRFDNENDYRRTAKTSRRSFD